MTTTTDRKRQAREYLRQLTRVVEGKAPGTRGPMGGKRVKIPDAFETVRAARCHDHDKNSTDFAGANEHGWVFRCVGWSQAEVEQMARASRDSTAVAGLSHYFNATPPESEPEA